MSKGSNKTIEADVEVISSKQTKYPKFKATSMPKKQSKHSEPADQQADAGNPFAGMAGMDGMPDLSAMFGAGGAGGAGGMPDLSKMPGLPFKQRMMFKLMRIFSSPKLRFLKSKWSIPIWGIVGILILALALTGGVLFLAFKLIKALLSPYFSLFKRK